MADVVSDVQERGDQLIYVLLDKRTVAGVAHVIGQTHYPPHGVRWDAVHLAPLRLPDGLEPGVALFLERARRGGTDLAQHGQGPAD